MKLSCFSSKRRRNDLVLTSSFRLINDVKERKNRLFFFLYIRGLLKGEKNERKSFFFFPIDHSRKYDYLLPMSTEITAQFFYSPNLSYTSKVPLFLPLRHTHTNDALVFPSPHLGKFERTQVFLLSIYTCIF